MQVYFAPMEGLTDSVYRRLHHKYFSGTHRYYMPFLSPTVHRALTNREQRELPFAESETFCAVPQLLTKVAEDFLWAADQCAQRGYKEVNLNLGCPSGTVVAKGKGAGMLRDLEQLDRFLDAIFSAATLPVSVKTRLGMEHAEEFPKLLELLNQYPVEELIIHPRVRKQFYDGEVNMDMFRYAAANCRHKLCYNGDVTEAQQITALQAQFPTLNAVMVGRGLLGDPGMFTPGGTKAPALEAFTTELLETYLSLFGGSRNAMFRMKEHWGFLHLHFADSDKLWKRLRKTTDLEEYRSITAEIFRSCPLV